MEVIPLITGLCILSVSYSVAQAELLKISPSVYSGREDPSWDIPKPIDATKEAHFRKLVNLLMKLPKPPKSVTAVGGYNGFRLNHILDNGENHLIEIAKCSYPVLETALLETAPTDINPKVLSTAARKQIQKRIDNCYSVKRNSRL